METDERGINVEAYVLSAGFFHTYLSIFLGTALAARALPRLVLL